MEISGVNNKNLVKFQIDKKVYHPFLSTPLDKVEINSQDPEQKENAQGNELQQVKELLDPRKNYKKLAAKIAGIAGGSLLVLGLGIVALTRGKSGMSEKIAARLQKMRGQTYELEKETSLLAQTRYKFKTKVVNLVQNGLNVWVNSEWFKNYLLSQKLIKNIKFIDTPVQWVVDKFGIAIRNKSFNNYKKCSKEVDKLVSLFPEMQKVIKNKHNNRVANEVILRLNKNHGLNLKYGETRAQVAEKLIKAISDKNIQLTSENAFKNRQRKLDEILVDLAKSYKDNFKSFSEQGGIKKFFKKGGSDNLKKLCSSLIEDTKTLLKSGKDLQARVTPEMNKIKAEKKELYRIKEALSRNIEDNYNRNIELLRKLENNIIETAEGNTKLQLKYNNIVSKDIRDLEKLMKSYKSAEANIAGKSRENYAQIFVKQSEELIKKLEKSEFNKDGQLKDGIECLKESSNRIIKDDPGLLEEFRMLLNLYDDNGVNLIKKDNPELYHKVKVTANNIAKKSKEAVNFEADNVTFRHMDLKLGGGHFEVLGLSTPMAFGIYSFTKGDSHEERVSNGIRSGTVIGGALAGWVISGIVLGLSAGAAIGFSLGAGLIFDRVGKFIDNTFWSHGRDYKAERKLKAQEAKTLNA